MFAENLVLTAPIIRTRQAGLAATARHPRAEDDLVSNGDQVIGIELRRTLARERAGEKIGAEDVTLNVRRVVKLLRRGDVGFCRCRCQAASYHCASRIVWRASATAPMGELGYWASS